MIDLLISLPLYFLNGLLFILYWLIAHLAEIIALGSGLAIAIGIDPLIQKRASDRPRRYERGEVQTASPTAATFTLFVLAFWLGASLISRFPVPMLGAAMWLTGFVSILAVSEERFNQAWWVKTGILVYAALVLDIYATFRGHWYFDPASVWKLRIINLPLEEVLFFVVIPFCSIFTWEVLNYFRRRR